jgi:hypothetical protein
MPVLAHAGTPRVQSPADSTHLLIEDRCAHADVAELDEDLPGTPQSAPPPVRGDVRRVLRVEQ